jgi:ankyrin repeat protein
MLLKAGTDPKARDVDGRTPLMYAAEFTQSPEVVTTLLKAGADAKAKDSGGRTAFDYARDNNTLRSSAAYKQLQEAMSTER